MIRAYDAAGLVRFLPADLAAAAEAPARPGDLIAVVVPGDFGDLGLTDKADLLREALRLGIRLLVCPETTQALDTEALRRLSRSRITRDD